MESGSERVGPAKRHGWRHGAVIAFCEEASEELFHFVSPLRASYFPRSALRPLVLMLEKE